MIYESRKCLMVYLFSHYHPSFIIMLYLLNTPSIFHQSGFLLMYLKDLKYKAEFLLLKIILTFEHVPFFNLNILHANKAKIDKINVCKSEKKIILNINQSFKTIRFVMCVRMCVCM